MTQIRLPDDKRDAIVARTRHEFGITDDDEKLEHRISIWSPLIAFAFVVIVGFLLWNLWSPAAATIFFYTFIGPIIIFQGVNLALQHYLIAWLVPNWSGYESALQQRICAATENYRREVMQTATYWENLDGHAFEREFARLLTGHGYRTEVTRGSGDGGVDIIADDGNGLIAVQCKRHKNPVGPAVIRELYGAVTAGKYRKGMLAVTGGVTKGIHEFIEGKPLQIVDLPQIVRLQMELNEKRREEQ